eukprot:scaffold61113_cov32-Tisochrysis_lutea.AAC.3
MNTSTPPAASLARTMNSSCVSPANVASRRLPPRSTRIASVADASTAPTIPCSSSANLPPPATLAECGSCSPEVGAGRPSCTTCCTRADLLAPLRAADEADGEACSRREGDECAADRKWSLSTAAGRGVALRLPLFQGG